MRKVKILLGDEVIAEAKGADVNFSTWDYKDRDISCLFANHAQYEGYVYQMEWLEGIKPKVKMVFSFSDSAEFRKQIEHLQTLINKEIYTWYKNQGRWYLEGELLEVSYEGDREVELSFSITRNDQMTVDIIET